MQAFKLRPAFKDYIWGGEKLKKEFNKSTDLVRVAEAWELSVHKDGESKIDGGENDGKALSSVLTPSILGKNCQNGLPILIKLIDAKESLSVQVHPNDEYANKYENDNGKTEMWYIVDAQKDAGIYCGFKREITQDVLREKIENNTLMDVLNFIPCKKGDSFFIPCGTVHAIGKGLTVCEVQQNSNVTYRLYDYGRTDSEGNKRPLHIEKASAVARLEGYKGFERVVEIDNSNCKITKIAECNYFTVFEAVSKEGGFVLADENSFVCAVVIEGEGKIASLNAKKGETVFIPAGMGKVEFKGKMTFIFSKIASLA